MHVIIVFSHRGRRGHREVYNDFLYLYFNLLQLAYFILCVLLISVFSASSVANKDPRYFQGRMVRAFLICLVYNYKFLCVL
ncbi:MAG: hypothetical protein VR68_04395 [Peptococcaceae bacterium BRH_c4a]|nr:MAG: hypothetical protein VR68_04395 [Peptococcaceae bacterium BRH_c4a]